MCVFDLFDEDVFCIVCWIKCYVKFKKYIEKKDIVLKDMLFLL